MSPVRRQNKALSILLIYTQCVDNSLENSSNEYAIIIIIHFSNNYLLLDVSMYCIPVTGLLKALIQNMEGNVSFY